MLLIISNAQYFRMVDLVYTKRYAFFSVVYTAYTKKYAVFRRVDTAYTREHATIFGGWILLKLNRTQYFRGVDTVYTKQHAVNSWDRYCKYWAISSVFGGGYDFYSALGCNLKG